MRPGADKRVAGGHPWAYSNEIEMNEAAKALPSGALVTLTRGDGGRWVPRYSIRIR
jgi:23S rRNA (cytosine1962-C5)-methyltransferase